VTFYNVLSALLFIGALRVLLLAFDDFNLTKVFSAACLAVVVFNDMLSTSHEVESTQSTKYTLPLMIIDLLNFVLLSLGMVVLSPSNNVFGVSLPVIAQRLGAPSFWLLLVLYWLFLMLWTYIACRHRGQPGTVVAWQFSVPGIFLIQWFLSVCALTGAATFTPGVVLAYLILYLTWIRPRVRKALVPC
jgi:hypothetical protein